MTPQKIRITFEEYASASAGHPTELLHRIRNLGEDIWRAIRGQRIATLENMDTAVDSLDLVVPSAGKVRRVVKIIEGCLAEHNFEAAQVEISVAPDS